MKTLFLFPLILLALQLRADTEDPSKHNPKLEAMMAAIAGQTGAVSDHIKKTLATETSNYKFTELAYKIEVAKILVDTTRPKVGAVNEGKVELGELAPKKLETLSGADLEEALKKVDDLLLACSDQLAKVAGALSTEATKEVSAHSYDGAKKELGALGKIIKEAHDAFKP